MLRLIAIISQGDMEQKLYRINEQLELIYTPSETHQDSTKNLRKTRRLERELDRGDLFLSSNRGEEFDMPPRIQLAMLLLSNDKNLGPII